MRLQKKLTKECLESMIKACDRIMDNLKVNKKVVNSVDRFSNAMNPFDGLKAEGEENEQDAEVTDFLLIREDDGEWREPLVEVEE